MRQQPSGNVTFLFTDIVGSTRLWEKDPAAMATALDRHERIIAEAAEANSGFRFKTVGDALYVAFSEGHDAIEASLQAQLELLAESWPVETPIRVRMGLHTGRAEERSGDYVGSTLNHCARLVEVGHGGQIVLSEATREVVGESPVEGTALLDLGAHRLRDLARPEHIYQLTHVGLPLEFPPLNSLDALPHNLPVRRSRFIGRQREIAHVQQLQDGAALLTLTGAGGVGKTRLALMVAAAAVDEFEDGVWFVDFGPLTDPQLVPQRVAGALGLRDEPGRSLAETLIEYASRRNMLLLLDNCEHLVDACAELAQRMLESAPRLKILATSREPLAVSGEVTWRVPGLSVPNVRDLPEGGAGISSAALRYSGVRLFQDRAVAAAPGFRLDDENALAVVEICRRLDGMPLAIELASARVKVLSAQQILDRLDDQLQLLTDGPRGAVPRQQTLRALIDWSYETLSQREKSVLRRLSTFRGGWTVEAAEYVCSSANVARVEVLDQLTALVSKSLVKVIEREGTARHALQETVQQYAWQQLVEAHEAEAALDRHLDWFLDLAERTEPELAVAKQAEWQARLELELDNLRTALRWSMRGDGHEAEDRLSATVGVELGEPTRDAAAPSPDGRREKALRLVGALHRFWERRGYLSEGREWSLRALSMPGSDAHTLRRAKALTGAGMLAWQQGDYFEAGSLSQEAFLIAEELGDHRRMAEALSNLATVAQHRGDYDAARSFHEQSLASWEVLGDKWGIAHALSSLGSHAYDLGEYREAAEFYEEGLALRNDLGDERGVATSLNALASIAYAEGDRTEARKLYGQSLEMVRNLGDRRNTAYVLNNMGRLALESGRTDDARELFEESLSLKDELGDPRGLATTLLNLGELARAAGDEAAGREHLRQSMAIRRDLGDMVGIAESLEALAAQASSDDDFGRAVRLYGASQCLRESLGAQATPPARSASHDRQAELRDALGLEAYEREWQAGAAMDWSEAVALALDEALAENATSERRRR